MHLLALATIVAIIGYSKQLIDLKIEESEENTLSVEYLLDNSIDTSGYDEIKHYFAFRTDTVFKKRTPHTEGGVRNFMTPLVKVNSADLQT